MSEIRIGLFAPSAEDSPVAAAVSNGAHLAVDLINREGGINGVPLRIVRRWDNDPWRGGSKEMIKLVYEDSVWAVIGSVNGESTHIAEQVVTKAWVPLLSPVSADPTLTYIRIPWMFRLPPNDEAQASVLARDGVVGRNIQNIGLITSTDHDGRVFAGEMLGQMSAVSQTPAFHFEVSPQEVDLESIAQRVRSFGAGGIIVRLPPSKTLDLLDRFQESGSQIPVMLPWIPGLHPSELRQRYSGDILYVEPFSTNGSNVYGAFARTYEERYGRPPTAGASYTFDTVFLLMASLREGGLNRADLRDAIAESSGYEGVTGQVTWDNAGGSVAQPALRVFSGGGY